MTTVVDANTYMYTVKMSLEHKVIMVHISILSREHCAVVEARVRAWSTTLKNRRFCRLVIAVPLKTWPIKMDFGQPNVEIVLKMSNGRRLFLALVFACVNMHIYICYMITNIVHTHTYMHMHTCIHKYTYAHAHINIHTCIKTYTNM